MRSQEIAQQHQELIATFQGLLGGKSSLKEAMGLTHDHINALAEQARELAEHGQNEEARKIFHGLVVLEPDNAHLWTCLGVLAMEQQDTEGAMKAFALALARNPDDIAANVYLGELYLHRQELLRALPYLERAATLDETGNNPHANRARALGAIIASLAKEVEEKGTEAVDEFKKRMQEAAARAADA